MPPVIKELRAARVLKGLSQRQVADAIGVCEATYQRFEGNLGNLNLMSLERLSELLEVEQSDILEWRHNTRRRVEQNRSESAA